MHRRRPLTALLVVAVVASTVGATVAVASPQPRYVCGTCGSSLERTAQEFDTSLTVTESHVTVQVRDDGSAKWTARTTLSPESADRLRENPETLSRILDELYGDESYSVVEDPASEIRTSFEGDTLVVEFVVDDVAHRSVGGVLLVDYFHGYGTTRRLILAADTMEMHGPEGTVVTNDVPGATERESAVVWRGGDRWGTDVSDEAFVAFGEDGGAVTRATTQVAIASEVAPMILDQAVKMAAIPGLVLFLFFGVALFGSEALEDRIDVDPEPLAGGIAVLGGLVSVLGVFLWVLPSTGVGSLLFPPALAYAAVAASTFALIRRERATPRGLLAAVALGCALAGAVAIVGAGGSPGSAVTAAFLTLPGLLFLPLGYAVATGSRRAIPLAVGVAASMGVGVLPVVPVQGLGAFFMAIALVGWALASGTFGLPMYLLGHRLAAESEGETATVGTESLASV